MAENNRDARSKIGIAIAKRARGERLSVTIKGGVKLTTLEIHDTNLKKRRVRTKLASTKSVATRRV
jgi:hypothetical protein